MAEEPSSIRGGEFPRTPSPQIAVEPSDGRPRRSRGRPSRGTSAAVNFLIAIPIAGLVLAGWFIFAQQEQLRRADESLQDAQERLAKLESRLRLTDETLSESEADTNQQLTFWESEIRKLWDMGNKRNRGWIETNRANVQKLTASIASAEADLKTLKSTVARLDTSANRQQEIADQVTALDIRMQRLIQQQRDLVDKANSASQIASSLRASLEPQVKENEEAIRAFDTHRAQINADIRDLRRQIGLPNVGATGP